MVNSGTWGKQVRTEKWTDADTELFYDVRAPGACFLCALTLTPFLARTGSSSASSGSTLR